MRAGAADVVVVGAGPAGLAAARELGRQSLNVTVVDEYPMAGGRLLGQLYQSGGRWWVGRQVADQLLEDISGQASVHLWLGQSVTGLIRQKEQWRVHLASKREPLEARSVLLATGATEIPIPLPGWTMPGVMSVGAAQVMANVHHVRPGRRGLIIGLGTLAFAVAQELSWAGVELAGIVLPPMSGPAEFLGHAPEQWRRLVRLADLAPGWVKPLTPLLSRDAWLGRMMAWAPRNGVPVAGTRLRPNVTALAIEGGETVSGVVLQRVGRDGRPLGNPWREAVDFVCLSGGLRPVPDLAVAVGAAIQSSRDGRYDVPLFGPQGETTAPGVFAAGNILGIEGAPVAMAQGQLASVGIIRYLMGRSGGGHGEAAAFALALAQARRQAPLVFDPAWRDIHRAVEAEWERRQQEATGREV